MSNSSGFTITIFAAAGELQGLRLVEKSNWSGKGLVCPRPLLRTARSRPEFSRPAVYLLIGPPGDGALPRIYIGEGDPVGPRLDSHAVRRDFWTSVIVFCAKDETLNKAHIQYLESRLISLAAETRLTELENANAPELPTLSENDLAQAAGFLEEMLLCLPIIGVHAFELATSAPRHSEILEISAKGIRAEGVDTSNGFLVLKDSEAVAVEVPSTQSYVKNLRQTLKDRGILVAKGVKLRFAQDYQFDSPSTAASVVLAKSANGRIEWKDKNGHTLRTIQDAGFSAKAAAQG